MNIRNVLVRKVLSVGAALAILPFGAGAQSQGHPVRMVVPFAAGGPADVIARKIAERLGPQLNTVVVVDNRPGANGVIGIQAVAKAPPDGAILLFATSGMLTISPGLYKDLSYDPLRDLTPIARVVANGTVLLVNKHIPANNIKELLAYAAKSPNPVPIGSAGTGNITHLYLELLKGSTQGNFVHIPYKGVAPALTDVMGGQIAGVFVDLPAALPLLKGGTVKALGMVGAERSPAAPDIPTIAEQGYKGVDGVSWFGVLGPVGMAPPAVERIHAALARVLAEPDVVKSLQEIGSVPSLDTPQEMHELIKSEQVRWAQLIKARNITVD